MRGRGRSSSFSSFHETAHRMKKMKTSVPIPHALRARRSADASTGSIACVVRGARVPVVTRGARRLWADGTAHRDTLRAVDVADPAGVSRVAERALDAGVEHARPADAALSRLARRADRREHVDGARRRHTVARLGGVALGYGLAAHRPRCGRSRAARRRASATVDVRHAAGSAVGTRQRRARAAIGARPSVTLRPGIVSVCHRALREQQEQARRGGEKKSSLGHRFHPCAAISAHRAAASSARIRESIGGGRPGPCRPPTRLRCALRSMAWQSPSCSKTTTRSSSSTSSTNAAAAPTPSTCAASPSKPRPPRAASTSDSHRRSERRASPRSSQLTRRPVRRALDPGARDPASSRV